MGCIFCCCRQFLIKIKVRLAVSSSIPTRSLLLCLWCLVYKIYKETLDIEQRISNLWAWSLAASLFRLPLGATLLPHAIVSVPLYISGLAIVHKVSKKGVYCQHPFISKILSFCFVLLFQCKRKKKAPLSLIWSYQLCLLLLDESCPELPSMLSKE